MLYRSVLFLLLVALGGGAAWFYYEHQRADEPPQRVADAPSDATPQAGEGAGTAPEPASQVRADAAVEAPAEAEASPGRSAVARAESDATSGAPGRIESRGADEGASTVTGEQVRLKGEAAEPAPAEPAARPAEAMAPSGSAVVKGQTSIPPSEEVAAAATPDARVDDGPTEEPPSEVTPAAPSPADAGAPAEEAERARTLPESPAPPEQDEQALAALTSDQRQPESGVPAPKAATEPQPAPEATVRPGEPQPAPQATEQEFEGETRPWWRRLSPDGLREALAAMIGGGEAGSARPSEDVAEQPRSAPEEAETGDAPSESLSAESIRRALAALVGGDEPPAPEAGPAEPAPEPEIVEPETVRPTFDIVRINRGGTAIIAGRAEPHATVEVVVGERVIDRVSADRRGQWVSTPLDPLEPGDRELTVVARLEDGGRIESDHVVVVAVPEPPPPQPPEMAASEAPPPQPPADARADAPDPKQTALAPDEAVAVLLRKDGLGGGRVLQAPGRISNDGKLALMVVDYDEDGRTRLSGEAPPGAPVRIYVDNQRAADVVAGASGEWQAVLEDELAPGTYTLRLDQLDAGGKPVARLETPFERVSQPPVAGRVAVDYVVVQPGNSLWRIARRLLGDGINYVHIYEANQMQIRDPDLIYPGQVFEVPKDLQVAG